MLRLRIFIGLIVGLIFCQALQGQLPRYKQWENIYGTAKNDIADKLYELGHGNYAVSGEVVPENQQPSYGHWFTFDSNGEELISGSGFVKKMSSYLDGGLIFATSSSCMQNMAPNYSDISVVHTNVSGELDWTACIGSGGNERIADYHILPSGNILVFGINSDHDLSGDYNENYGGRDAWVVMLSDSGTIIWEQHYGGSGDEIINGHIQVGDNHLLLIKSDSEDFDLAEFEPGLKKWLLLIDDSGKRLLSKSINNEVVLATYNHSLTLVGDSSIYYAGNVYGTSAIFPSHNNPPNSEGSDGVISRINLSSGQVEFVHLFGGTQLDLFDRIQKKSNGNLVLGGTTRSFDGDLSGRQPEDSEVWLVEMDTAGNIIDQFFPDMGGSGGGYNDFLLNEQDEIILLSENNNKDAFPEHYGQFDHELPRDYYIFKLGYTPVGITENTISTGFTLYPTPNSTGLLHSSQKGNYILRDLQGRMIKEFYNSKSLDLSQIQSGTYIVQDQNGASQRVVLQ